MDAGHLTEEAQDLVVARAADRPADLSNELWHHVLTVRRCALHPNRLTFEAQAGSGVRTRVGDSMLSGRGQRDASREQKRLRHVERDSRARWVPRRLWVRTESSARSAVYLSQARCDTLEVHARPAGTTPARTTVLVVALLVPEAAQLRGSRLRT